MSTKRTDISTRSLYLPKDLAAAMREWAEIEGRSVNAQIIWALKIAIATDRRPFPIRNYRPLTVTDKVVSDALG